MVELSLRKKAAAKGEQWYKSDSTCIHGHVNPVRYTGTGGCKTCIRIKNGGTFNKTEWNSTEAHWGVKQADQNRSEKPIPKRRKRTATVLCKCQQPRRTVKQWIKDKVAAW